MSIFKLIREFSKRYGRSPSPSELDKLKKQSDIIQQQDTVIPFPGGGKDKVSPFKPRPKAETEAEMLERMNRQNKESVERLKKKKEKDLGDRLKDYDGDPDAMAEGGLMRLGMFAGGVPFRRLLQFLNQQTGRTGSEGLNKLKLPDQMKFFAEKQGFNPDQNRIEYVEQVLDALKADRKLIRSLESDAPSAVTGKAKDEMELIADKMFTENFLGDTQKGRFKGMTSKDYDKSILEVETILKNLKPEGRKPNAEGGRAGYSVGGVSKLLKMLQGKVGKKNITTADKIARPESALNREMFGDFNERVNRKILDVPPMPSGFQLSREKLLKNFPELDESYADEIMAMDKELQGRVLTMLKDRRKNPEAYDKLLMEKGDTLDFQGEFDRSVKRSKNAAGGLAYMLGETRDGLEKGGSPSDVAAYRQMSLLDRDFDTLDLDEIIDILKSIGVDNKADGGIIGLKEGGPPNPGRRNFMKLMAGLASIPVLGKFFKPAAKVAKTVVPLQNTTTTMPTWFPKLIDKALDKGIKNKIDADLTDIKVPELPGVKIQRHDDGRVLVEGKNDYGKPYAIEYEPPGFEVVNEKTGKAVKTKGDFKAIDSVPENSGYPDDVPDFWPEQLDEVDEILGSDVRVMEEFAEGKKIKTPKKGENIVGQAEVRAENAADEAAERAAMEAEDFATGGLAKLLGE